MARPFLSMSLVAASFFVITTQSIPHAIAATAQSVADQSKLISTAKKVRAAILHVDIKTLIELISSSDGLECTDDVYNKDKITHYLSTTHSILYESLFDAPRFSRRCGVGYPAQYPATSDKAFFETAPDGNVEVTFAKGNYAAVKFISAAVGYYPREYSFKKEGTDWKLVGGFIVGNCSCG